MAKRKAGLVSWQWAAVLLIAVLASLNSHDSVVGGLPFIAGKFIGAYLLVFVISYLSRVFKQRRG